MRGSFPWPILQREMRHFQELTRTTNDLEKMNAVVMGRKTWESIPVNNRPLSNRINIVLSRREGEADLVREREGVVKVFRSFEDSIRYCKKEFNKTIENVFIIGGSSLFRKSFSYSFCKRIYYTEIQNNFKADTFIDSVPSSFVLQKHSYFNEMHSENGVDYYFKMYERIS